MARQLDPLAVRHRQAARLLGVSEKTLYLWVKRGLLPCKKVGGVCVYAVRDLEAFLGRKDDTQGGGHGVDR